MQNPKAEGRGGKKKEEEFDDTDALAKSKIGYRRK